MDGSMVKSTCFTSMEKEVWILMFMLAFNPKTQGDRHRRIALTCWMHKNSYKTLDSISVRELD